MNRSSVSLFLYCFAATLGSALVGGCQSASARAEAALAAYQSAEASGDLKSERKALIALVAADEDNADYWTSLGRVQLSLRAFPDAFYAFSRALELNRDDPSLLRILTQLALKSDNLELATQYTRKLELLLPGDPAVMMTNGVIALQQGDLATAETLANRMAATGSADSDARVLKSQVLLRQGKGAEAIALLQEQLKTTPSDAYALRALANLYQRGGDWKHVAPLRKQMWLLNKSSPDFGVSYIDAAFRAGDVAGARDASSSLLTPDVPLVFVQAVLDLWAQEWPGNDRVAAALQLAAKSSPAQKIVYAAFLNRVGAAKNAVALISAKATLPVTVANIPANTVAAETMVLTGQGSAARPILDAVLELDPQNIDAIRARARLELSTGNRVAAVYDARKLVSLAPTSIRDRLLLTDCYLAGGDLRQAERSLWDAFHEVPGDEQLHAALRNLLLRHGQIDAAQSADREFADQQDLKFTKDLA